MPWQLTDDLDAYVSAAGDLLGRDPARHTIGLTVVENARARKVPLAEPETYGWWTEPDGAVTGACSHTPPHPWVVEVAPGHTRLPLITAWVTAGIGRSRPTSVNASADLAVELAALWSGLTGGRATLLWAQRLFGLDVLRWPEPMPPGSARLADENDSALVGEWSLGFARDIGAEATDAVVASVEQRLESGGMHLWRLDDGTPASMAARTLPAAGAVRIGPVYTPPGLRGRGYAGAVTAAASEAALRQVGTVVLFTDLANPTSNALYPRLGYRPVTDRAVFRLDPPSGGPQG